MKLYTRMIAILGLTGMILSGCNDDEKPSVKASQLNSLSGTWEVTAVTMDNVDVTSAYSSFDLTLSGSTKSDVFAYGATGRPDLSPWPAGGTWSFGTDVKSELVRDPNTVDVLHVDYTVTKTELTIEFMFNGEGYDGSRVNSAAGNWTYTFTKK